MPSMSRTCLTRRLPAFGTKERMRYERKMRKRARKIRKIGIGAWLLREMR